MSKSLNELRDEIFQTAKDHGWYPEGTERSFGDLIALAHSELSEALEEFRSSGDVNAQYFNLDSVPRKMEGVPSELADVIIRVLDMCGFYGVDIEDAVLSKMAYNKTRSFRHGGSFL